MSPCSALRSGRAFRRDRRGSTAILFGLAAPLLVGAAGYAVEHGEAVRQSTALSALADSSALAAARNLGLAQPDNSGLDATVDAVVEASPLSEIAPIESQVEVTPSAAQVTVRLSQARGTWFFRPRSWSATTLHASATARLVGDRTCVIGLDGAAADTVRLDSNARISAKSCSVQSNSRHPGGLRAESNARIEARRICSSGGSKGGSGNFAPRPQNDCPAAPDPLAGRARPAVGACLHNKLVVKDVSRTLDPGTYCGGLTIDGNATVTLRPGVYVMKDGPLRLDSNARVEGTHVGFFFTGAASTMSLSSNSRLDVSAPKSGALAGLLLFEDPSSPPLREFKITSNYARRLVGTIYLPQGRFIVDANQNVADFSEYTAVVVRRLELFAGPNLVLNTNYGMTDVPVPDGLADGRAHLVR